MQLSVKNRRKALMLAAFTACAVVVTLLLPSGKARILFVTPLIVAGLTKGVLSFVLRLNRTEG